MSGLGQNRTFTGLSRMSGFGGKADVVRQPSECPLIARTGHWRCPGGGAFSQREEITGRVPDRQIGSTKGVDRCSDGRIRTGFDPAFFEMAAVYLATVGTSHVKFAKPGIWAGRSPTMAPDVEQGRSAPSRRRTRPFRTLGCLPRATTEPARPATIRGWKWSGPPYCIESGRDCTHNVPTALVGFPTPDPATWQAKNARWPARKT